MNGLINAKTDRLKIEMNRVMDEMRPAENRRTLDASVSQLITTP